MLVVATLACLLTESWLKVGPRLSYAWHLQVQLIDLVWIVGDESGSVIASWFEITENLESTMLGDCSMMQANHNGFIVQNCDVNCFGWNVCDCAPVMKFWRNSA